MKRSAYLVLIHSESKLFDAVGRRYEIEKKGVTIGSDKSAQIQLPEEIAEPHHLFIFFEENGWHLKDVSHTEVVEINQMLKKTHTFERDGELIRIGPLVFKFFLGTGIESAYEQALYQRGIIDPLTGSYNRRYLEERLQEELARLSRHQNDSLAIVIFDIDHFRRINNTYGHLAGDAALKEVVHRVNQRLRKDERLTRYGGEEFAIILPGASRESATKFAEQIRQKIEKPSFSYQNQTIPLTISLGIASASQEMHYLKLIELADKNLYLAKAGGRNQVRG